MKIRKNQMKVYEIARFPAFENQMLNHIELNFNDLASLLGKERTSKLIHHGYNRAVSYGFITAYEITLYIDLMCHLGPDFDTDERIQWTQGIFDTRFFNTKDQIEFLYHVALEYVEKMTNEVDGDITREYEMNIKIAFKTFFTDLKIGNEAEVTEQKDEFSSFVSYTF